jgi:flagellar motor switch protein FliG
MSSDAKNMSDVRRVAIILAQLDFDQQNELLSKFSETEVFQVMSEMARLPVISHDLLEDVIGTVVKQMKELSRARQGGIGVAEAILKHRFGPARALEMIDRLQESAPIEAPLSFLNRIEPQQLHGVCTAENPQAVAILLAHIDAPLAATVLGQLGEETRADVTLRIAKLGLLPASVIQRLASVLDQRLSTFVRSGGSDVALDGVATAVQILNNSDRASEKDILAKLDQANPDLAEKIRSEMFGWEDAVKLDDRTLQRVLRDVTMPGLAKALKNKDADVIEKFKSNLSSRQVDDLQEEMEALGLIRLSDVEQEESVIVKSIRQLADEGEIDIVRSEEESLV